MITVVTIAAGLAAGLVVRAVMYRSGVGGLLGDMTLGMVGAMLGTYTVMTYDMGHSLNHLYLLVAGNAFGVGVFLLVLIHMLSRRMPDAPDSDMDDAVVV